VSAYDGALDAIDRILDADGDADEVLREAVAVLYRLYSWVGISFVEEGELVLGLEQGEQSAEPTRIPISYENNVVAELAVAKEEVGTKDRAFLERVAELIAPFCLVGWDTGGETWMP
jgi:putative methionine-R-sulfoxide reductase with GAF domain